MLPSIRKNPFNRALSTTVYAPSQTQALELLPRFHRYAFQEREDAALVPTAATLASEFSEDDGSLDMGLMGPGSECPPPHDFPATREPSMCSSGELGDPSERRLSTARAKDRTRAVALFRPQPREQQVALARARRAAGRPLRLSEAREGPVGAGLPERSAPPPTPPPAPTRWNKTIDEALRLLQPPEAIAPLIRHPPAARTAPSRADERLREQAVGAGSRPEEGPAGAASRENANARAVRKLFARQRRAPSVHTDDTGYDSSSPSSSSSSSIHSSRSRSRSGGHGSVCISNDSHQQHDHSCGTCEDITDPDALSAKQTAGRDTLWAAGRRPLPGAVPALVTELVEERLRPLRERGSEAMGGRATAVLPPLMSDHHLARSAEGHVARVTAVSYMGEGVHSSGMARGLRDMRRALRWLLYEEQYHRQHLVQIADAEYPVPWQRESHLQRAAGEQGRQQAVCTLHPVDFRSDTAITEAASAALDAYIARRVAAHSGGGGGGGTPRKAQRSSGSAGADGCGTHGAGTAVAAAVVAAHEAERARTLREAEREKEAAFAAALRYRRTIQARLSLVEEERAARLALLGHFASCAWPEPCRCLRWDQEILETSAVPLEPRLDPICVYVSTVLGEYEVLATELLAQRTWELGRMRERHELKFMAFYVLQKLVRVEERSFLHIVTYHTHCMALAAKAGVPGVPARYANLPALAAFESPLTSEPAVAPCASVTAATAGQMETAALGPSPGAGDGSMDDGADAGEAPATAEAEAAAVADTQPVHEVEPPTSTADVSTNAPVAQPSAAALVRGPRDSPFCSLLTFVNMVIVQGAEKERRRALAMDEAVSRAMWERHLRRQLAVATLETDEQAARVAVVEVPEAEARSALRRSCDADAVQAHEAAWGRLARERMHERTTHALTELADTAGREHADYMAELEYEFTELHKQEVTARRWAWLRGRQRLEGTGADVVARIVLERDLAAVERQELECRQRCFTAEEAAREVLQGAIRIDVALHVGREQLMVAEDHAFRSLLLTELAEGVGRLRVQDTYAYEQFTLFGRVVRLEAGTGGEDPVEVEGCHAAHEEWGSAGTRTSPCWAAPEASRAIHPAAETANDAGSWKVMRHLSVRRARLNRRRSSVAVVLDGSPTHPMEAAAAMQWVALFNLHDFLPDSELLDIFSS